MFTLRRKKVLLRNAQRKVIWGNQKDSSMALLQPNKVMLPITN